MSLKTVIRYIAISFVALFGSTLLYANDFCCNDHGGINYCDTSSGRYVCHSGEFSYCYCTRRAAMEMHAFKGCCMWHGGVKGIDYKKKEVICRDHTVAELCGLYRKSASSSSLWSSTQ